MREPYTINEATRILAVSDKTIRRMLKAGVLKEHSREGVRILIDPDSVDQAAVALGRADIRGQDVRRELAPTMNNLSEMVMGLHDMIFRQNERISELSRELGRMEAERELYPRIAAERERRIEQLEGELSQTREELHDVRQVINNLLSALIQTGDQESGPDQITSLRAKLRKLLSDV
jgi:excisionase family DNA binding protein